MSLSPIDRAVLDYLRKYPNSRPREIADALGFSIVSVRSSLYRLRERGLVARTSRGYIARTEPWRRETPGEERETPQDTSTRDVRIDELRRDLDGLRDRVSEIEKSIQDFAESITKIERQIAELRLSLRSLYETMSLTIRRTLSDPFIARLSSEKIMGINEARRYASEGLGSLDKYVEEGVAVVIGKIVVSRDFYDSIVSQLPMSIEKLNSLGPREKILIETMVSEGYAYIDQDHMIRLVSE